MALAVVFAPHALAADAPAGDAEAIRTLLARGEFVQALAQVDKALAASPRDQQLIFLRGVVLMDARRDADALAQFERMTQDYPELADPWNNIALLQIRAGHPEQAQRSLETALRNDPTHRVARANLGLVHLMLAEQAWQQLADTGPVDAALRHRLQTVRSLLGESMR